jgi:NADPH-dependent 2,4-dienoyl-CoA reductase/sulfur reductase-like enzyme
MERRQILKAMGAAGILPFLAAAKGTAPRVVVVGGGFGGATCAHYLKLIDPQLHVTLIERSASYTTCPLSNNVIGGLRTLESITHNYGMLGHFGITLVRDEVTSVDSGKRTVTLASGKVLAYDRLVLSPGIEMNWGAIEGYEESAAETMPHAWKAGPQTVLLQKQLAAAEDGALVVIAAPENPYRCPPAPYERACMIAHYFKTNGKTKSKIVILDAKDKFTKQELFIQGWERFYPGMIEWVPGSKGGQVTKVDPKIMTVTTKGGEFKPAVANIVPPQQAARIAQVAGVATQDGWCEVDPWTMESKEKPGVHVIGDACVPGAMPKSGFAANSQAKICAAAVAALLRGRKPVEPVFMNTCYSTIAPDYAISVAGTYRASNGAIVAVMGTGGLSPMEVPDSFRRAEYDYAQGWYASTMQEMFG